MEDEALARALSAIGHPIRLGLYRSLVAAGAAGDGPVSLASRAGIQRPLISYHLQPLVAAGLVTSERRGRDVNYRVVPGGLSRLASDLLGLGVSRDEDAR